MYYINESVRICIVIYDRNIYFKHIYIVPRLDYYYLISICFIFNNYHINR